MSPLLSARLNALGLLAISLVLVAAFADQLLFGELPCPLCIMQRVGFVAVGLGLALNLRFGPRPSHYAVMILSAAAGGVISVRQVLLHIVPGTGTYGSALFGMHYYTWAAVLAAAIIVGAALMLMFERQFTEGGTADGPLVGLSLAIFALATLLAFGNGVSTVLICGFTECPDNPTSYLLLR